MYYISAASYHPSMTVLVLGASGYTGRAVTRALTARSANVRAFIRNPDAAATARADGAAEVVIGDFRDVSAIAAAAKGADGVYFIGPRFMAEEATLGMAVIDAAVQAGVRRFVYSGVYHPTIRALVNHQTKRCIEDHLYKTDLEFTVLQPARYLHGVLFSSWRRMMDDGVLADAFAPHVPMAYVDYRDVAEVAAIAFTDDRLVRGTFELSAEGQPTLHELATVFGKELGRSLRAAQMPLDDYPPAASLMTNPYSAHGFRRLRRYYDEYGFRGGNSLVLATILGRPPTDHAECFRAFAGAVAATGKG
jgi:uncharacterized protein YbjT (DUF2867 family)